MRAATFHDRFPVIRCYWLQGALIYHAREDDIRKFDIRSERLERYSEEVALWEERTRCGLLLSSWERGGKVLKEHGHVFIEREKADLIARPCERCFR